MSSQQPQLGSLAIQAPSLAPKTVHVSASTCHDISLFKDLMKEYRKLDDTITMRLNRTTAQFRDRDRQGLRGKGSIEDETCMQIWRELVANWKRRSEIVEYCVGVVDRSMSTKRMALDAETEDPATRRRIQGALYAEEVKRNQIHNELAVEQIVRKRSLDAFHTRCRYFEPPLTDAEARRWWEVAQAGR